MIRFLKKISIPLVLSLIFLFALSSKAGATVLQLNYPTVPGINKSLNDIANASSSQQLALLIQYVYYIIIYIAGFAAFVMIVWGGVQWLISTGNPSSIRDARDKITKALLGLVIVLGSYIILNTINPDLVNLTIHDPIVPPGVPSTSQLLGTTNTNNNTPGFTINGGTSAAIKPGQSVTLAWNASGGWGYCDAQATPTVPDWNSNSLPTSGSQTITLNTENTYDFYLTCGEGGAAQVTAFVSSSPPPTTPPTITSFTANGYSGDSFTMPSTQIPGQNVTFAWASQNATECVASGSWSEPISTSGSVILNVYSELSVIIDKTGHYTLTCKNGSGIDASSTITIVLTQ